MALNVLVTDDSAVMRAMIIKTLRLAEVPLGEVHEAADGLEGLAALHRHWIDLVFVDINMPVMNGEEMIGEVRANPAWETLPIVVVSTEGSKTRIDRLDAMGTKFVHKPFTPETIRQIVLEMTGISHERNA